MDHSITIAELKYPKETNSLIFLFDQSSGHTAFAENALNVNRMNVRPGGVQPVLRDTIWNGRLQRMVFSNGTPKGMRQVLTEWEIDTTEMKASDLRQVLGEMSDFKYEKTKVEHMVINWGYRAIFYSKISLRTKSDWGLLGPSQTIHKKPLWL